MKAKVADRIVELNSVVILSCLQFELVTCRIKSRIGKQLTITFNKI